MLEKSEKYIDEHGYEKSRSMIEEYAGSNDRKVRSELAVLLCNYVNRHSEGILIKLLYDKAVSVRIEAAE